MFDVELKCPKCDGTVHVGQNEEGEEYYYCIVCEWTGWYLP